MIMLFFLNYSLFILYIGPGLGAGTVAAIIGILTSFFLSLVAVFWYPLKRLIRFIVTKFNKK